MHFIVFLLNIIIWIATGVYVGKYAAGLYKNPSKKFVKSVMQKSAVFALFVGLFASLCIGTDNINAYFWDLAYVVIVTFLFAMPKQQMQQYIKNLYTHQDELVTNLEKIWNQREKYIQKFVIKYVDQLPLHR